MAKPPGKPINIAGFKLVSETKPKATDLAQKSPVARFLAGIDKQLAYVKLELSGEELPQTTKGRAPKLAYFNVNGTWYLSLRYANRPLLINGMSTLECGPELMDVKKCMLAVREAAKEEPLLTAINELAATIGKRRGKPY